MARIFAYVTHKGGVPDDSALELLAAAKQMLLPASHGNCYRLWRRTRRGVRDASQLLQRGLEDCEG